MRLYFNLSFLQSRLANVGIALLSACTFITAFAEANNETLILKFIQDDFNYLNQHPLSVDGTNVKGSYRDLETHVNTSYSPVEKYDCTGVFTVAIDNTEINGKEFWYPIATLGTMNSGAALTITFNKSAKIDYVDDENDDAGLYVSKVVIKGCGNKYSREAAVIRVNGKEKEVPYTETPDDNAQGKIKVYDLTFEFGADELMNALSIEAPATGISFNSIEVYAVKMRKLSFDKPNVDVPFPNGERIKLQSATAIVGGNKKPFGLMCNGEIGSIYLYEVLKADGTSAGDVSYIPVEFSGKTYTDLYFTPKEEGLYTVRTYMSGDSGFYGEASYLLNVYWVNSEMLTFNSGINHDGIIELYDRYIDKDGNLRTDSNVCIEGIPDGSRLYYRVWDDPDFTPSQDLGGNGAETLYRAVSDDSIAAGPVMKAVAAASIDGMTLYDAAAGVDMSNGDTIDIALEKNGSLSPAKSIRYQKINVPVGVETVLAPTEDATYFHIDGRRADDNAKGLLIRLSASGQADKIIRR